MKKLLLVFIVFTSCKIIAQINYKITYEKSSNGTRIENQDLILLFANEKESIITTENIINKKATFPYEQSWVTGNILYQVANLNASKTIITRDSTSISKQTFEFSNEQRKIKGYDCKKAKTIINSNSIEIWYTNDLKINGSPTVLGQKLGLVLEVVRNGNFIITATKVEKAPLLPDLNIKKENTKPVNSLTYKDLLWKSRFTTISIFKDEIINFSDTSTRGKAELSEAKSNDSILRFANGTIILKKVKFPSIPKGSQVFVDVNEQSNGDAYDRTGCVFMIPMDKKLSFLNGLQNGAKTLPIFENGNGKQYQGIVADQNFSPLLELMRFFTPFGIKQYNHIQLKDKTWEESVNYRQDISELTAAFSEKEVYIGTFIGNYDKGGHKVTVNITIHNEENALAKPSNVIPLFNTINVMEMAGQEYGTLFSSEKGLEMKFTIEKDIKNVRLRYITTGHGGWENGDEFIPKKNTLFLDGKEVFHFTPWREDCGSYRLYNPASGNFSNGLSSSDYSRANWCPGMVTNPVYIDLGDLKAGEHSLQLIIPQGKPEGTSFSSWNVSGVLIGE
jgi:GLPGLI family protein